MMLVLCHAREQDQAKTQFLAIALFHNKDLETSAKMLSIVPLLAGSVILETGADGSASNPVEQILKEGHLSVP